MSKSKVKDQKVYMPLMVGDWLKGTSGMRAEVRGVYINLLLHQWEHGFLPEDIDELILIAPEIGKVWDKLKVKFPKVSDGQLQNRKLEEVRDFWKKQRKNGSKGGRPKKENPDDNPNQNPNNNPKGNHHNDLDLDYDNEEEKLKEYDDWTDQIIDGNDHIFASMFKNEMIPPGDHIQFWIMDHRDLLNRYPRMRPPNQQAFRKSCLKHVRENYKKPIQGNGTSRNKKQEHIVNTADFIAKHYGHKAS
jgi:uncharacterized protein YdaU (DUF1376 family)